MGGGDGGKLPEKMKRRDGETAGNKEAEKSRNADLFRNSNSTLFRLKAKNGKEFTRIQNLTTENNTEFNDRKLGIKMIFLSFDIVA